MARIKFSDRLFIIKCNNKNQSILYRFNSYLQGGPCRNSLRPAFSHFNSYDNLKKNKRIRYEIRISKVR